MRDFAITGPDGARSRLTRYRHAELGSVTCSPSMTWSGT